MNIITRSQEDIKFELCFRLRQENILFTQKYSNKLGTTWGVSDIAVLNKEYKLVGIIEVKSIKEANEQDQLEKYETFKVPNCLCSGMAQINNALNFAHECVGNKLVSAPLKTNFPGRKSLSEGILVTAKNLHEKGLNSSQIAKKLGLQRRDIRPFTRIWNQPKRLAKKIAATDILE